MHRAPIPMVDVRALFDGNASQIAATAKALGAAARGYGFLYVTGHRVPARCTSSCCAQEFFALPLAEKMRVYIGNSRNHRGYVPEGEEGFEGGTRRQGGVRLFTRSASG
jgi:isopenicillin N synthase-like dioxygenase